MFELHTNQNPRLQLLYPLVAILFIILLTGIFYRQILQGHEYSLQEEKQNNRLIQKPAPRGYIYDRNENLLVGNRPRYSAVVYLNELRPEFRAKYRDLREKYYERNQRFDSNKLEQRARREVVQHYLEKVSRTIGRKDKAKLSRVQEVKLSQLVERHFHGSLILPLPLVKDLNLHEYSRLIEQMPVDSPVQPHVTSSRRYPYENTAAHILGYVVEGDQLRFNAAIPQSAFKEKFQKLFIKLRDEIIEKEESPTIDSAALKEKARHQIIKKYKDFINQILDSDYRINNRNFERFFQRNTNFPIPLCDSLTDSDLTQLTNTKSDLFPMAYYPQGKRFRIDGYKYPKALPKPLLTSEKQTKEKLITFRIKGNSGRTGIERSLDDHLLGRDGNETWIVDPAGIQFERTLHKKPVKGNDLHLSIDLDLQHTVEQALEGNLGAAVAIDVNTGEILAMASKPDYNPNTLTPYITTRAYHDINKRRAWQNRAIQGLYPPASTFKIVSAISGFKANIIDSETTSMCRGRFKISNRYFKCHNIHGHSGPPVNLEYSLIKSCNVFFYEWGIKTTIANISRDARIFGFHRPTGIELPHETTRMLVPDPPWKNKVRNIPWFPGDTANVAIGQGDLRVTPLQMAAFTASFARKETRTKVTILKVNDSRMIDHGGQTIDITEEQYNRIINGMELAVSGTDEGRFIGTAHSVHIPGIRIAGKTGTAEHFAERHKINHAWFIGFAPIENPMIAVAVLVEGIILDPLVEGAVIPIKVAGGLTAAPVANKIFRTYFNIAEETNSEFN